MVVPAVALEDHGRAVHEEVDLEAGEAGVERRRWKVVVGEQPRHAQLELAVGGLAVQGPGAQGSAECGCPIAAAARVPGEEVFEHGRGHGARGDRR